MGKAAPLGRSLLSRAGFSQKDATDRPHQSRPPRSVNHYIARYRILLRSFGAILMDCPPQTDYSEPRDPSESTPNSNNTGTVSRLWPAPDQIRVSGDKGRCRSPMRRKLRTRVRHISAIRHHGHATNCYYPRERGLESLSFIGKQTTRPGQPHGTGFARCTGVA